MDKTKLKQIIWYGLLVIVLIMGVKAFYTQTIEGHHVTGITKDVPWGIYIVGFIFFVGASAGSTLIGFIIHAFGREDYKRLGVRAIIIGLLSLAAAMMFIMADVGKILRMSLVPWVYRNPTSMFMYTAITYYIFGLLLLSELYFLVKVLRGKATETEKKLSKWLAIVAVPFALLVVHGPHGALFAVIKAREFWNTPLLPIHFIFSALATGTALLILATAASSQLHKRNMPLLKQSALHFLGILFAVFLGVALVFDLSDLLVLKYSEHPEGIEAWHILSNEHTALMTINWAFLLLALFIVSFKKGRTIGMMSIAAILALVGIGAYRYNLVIVPQKVALLPGMDKIHYSPTGIELWITAGIFAFVMLVYYAALKFKPIKEALDAEMAEVDALEGAIENPPLQHKKKILKANMS